MVKNTTKIFIERMNKKHDNFYIFDKVDYKNRDTEVIITCPIHGDFIDIPKYHYRNGCKDCKIEKEQIERARKFIEKSKLKHNNFYKYDRVNKIKKLKDKVEIYCPKHNKYFPQRAEMHQRGNGCRDCRYEKMTLLQTDTLESFINKANKKHNNFFIYDKVNYIDSFTEVEIICPIGGHRNFNQIPNAHLNGQGWPICSKNGFSNIQFEWLKLKRIIDNTYIQHKKNKGEYLIDIKLYNTNERRKPVDGYSKELNKVYEFHGDYWHGNPKKYSSNDYNTTCKKTFGKLYNDTKLRINKMKEKGYNIEVMWEYDWKLHKKLIKQIINYN